ncbi:MAG: trypsin-like peptidase domain-containing protein [Gaiellaceae bacterium]
MRFGRLAVVAVVCALLGGFAALLVGRLTGWTDGSTTTVFRASPLLPSTSSATPAAVGLGAKPLAGNGFDPRTIYARRSLGVVTIWAQYGKDPASAQLAQGSGFVVTRGGYILTNSHVIRNAGNGGSAVPADSVAVEFQDRDRAAAKIVGWDVFDDVGLLKVDPAAHALAPVPLGDSATIAVGQPVAAIGSPFGNENSLGVGVISAAHRSIESLTSTYNLVDAIQTDAPINHGNSGGPLFDARGRVIGINAQIRSDTGNGVGVGFAVPINSAKRSMDQLIANGSVSYAFVGVVTADLTPALARHFGYSVTRGAVITKVEPSSPAQAAHLRAGRGDHRFLGVDFTGGADVIVAIDGRRVTSSEDVVRIVTDRLSPGQVARFTIVRGSSRVVVPVRLAQRPVRP